MKSNRSKPKFVVKTRKNKTTLKKTLRGCRAQWCKDETEVIVGYLNIKDRVCLPAEIQFGIDKGWLRQNLEGKYIQIYFTPLGAKEILQPLKETTCITGRVVR